MPGLYQRDNLAQQLAQAIEMAQQRRERNQAVEDARRESNVKAITGFAEALGRTYETSPSVLAKRRQELLDEIESIKAAKGYEQSMLDKYDEQVAMRNKVNDYLTAMNAQDSLDEKMQKYSGPTQAESYSNAMAGYEPSRLYRSPLYADSTLGLLDDRAELESRLDQNYDNYYPIRKIRYATDKRRAF